MVDIEKIIQSTVSRVVHDTPSQKTNELISCLNASLQKHIEDENFEKAETNEGINEIKKHLQRQDEMFAEFIKETKEHMLRVEPVIQRFEDEKAFNVGVKEIGKRAIFWSKVIGAIGVIILAVKYFFIHLISR